MLALSARVAAACALSLAVPGIFFGWSLARVRFRGRSVVDAFFHAPLVMPPVVTGYLLLLLLAAGGFSADGSSVTSASPSPSHGKPL